MEKYKPLLEHYINRDKGYECEIEVYLMLHNSHINVLEALNKKK
ncbi:MAG: hypothetical protein ACI9NI_001978 [Olleya marilimosa]|jgi:hypothetical protein